jgi:hypothetical protein
MGLPQIVTGLHQTPSGLSPLATVFFIESELLPSPCRGVAQLPRMTTALCLFREASLMAVGVE